MNATLTSWEEKVTSKPKPSRPELRVFNAQQDEGMRVEKQLDLVTFCHRSFYAGELLSLKDALKERKLLSLQDDAKGKPLVFEDMDRFVALVKRLNDYAVLSQDRGLSESPAVFFVHDSQHSFQAAIQRMAVQTTWQVKFMPSLINPGRGVDCTVILRK